MRQYVYPEDVEFRAEYVDQPVLYITIPCYNEQEVLRLTIKCTTELLQSLIKEGLISGSSRLLFIDDGSRDSTWFIIAMESARNPHLTGIKLARNAGHQKALMAGLMYAQYYCDCAVSMDADLQDDPRVVRDFVLRYREGNDIVYGVRRDRSTDSWFKRWSAEQFYRMMERMGVPLIYNHADYRLMSKRALEVLAQYQEVNLFLRGIVPLIGLQTAEVSYDRQKRAAGETKYPLRKMLSFAWEGITSSSIKPLRIVTAAGAVGMTASGLVTFYALLSKWTGYTASGWTSLMASLWFIGSLQLLAIGVIGEYIGKIYIEVKQRPIYSIDQIVHSQASLDSNHRKAGETG